MNKNNQQGEAPHKRGRRQYRISVRAAQRETPDIRKLARAAIELAMAQAETDAQAESDTQSSTVKTTDANPSRNGDDS